MRLLNKSSSPVNWRAEWTVRTLGATFFAEVEYLDAALEHEEEIHRALTALEDQRVLRELLDMAIGAYSARHVFTEAGKYLGLAVVRIGRI